VQPQISICRKRENLYLKLTGDFNESSSGDFFHAIKKLVLASLRISPPDAKVAFTFQTHGKVNFPKGKP
jgi:hypothetical protein